MSKNPLNTFNTGRLELDSKKPTRTPKSAYTKGWVQGRGSQEREHKAPEWLRVQTRPYDLCTKVHGPPRRTMLRAEPHKGCRTARPAKHTESLPAGTDRQGEWFERGSQKNGRSSCRHSADSWPFPLPFRHRRQMTCSSGSLPLTCYPTAS